MPLLYNAPSDTAKFVFPADNVKAVKLLQLPKAAFPIVVNEFGMAILVIALHPSKANVPTVVMDDGSVMLDKIEHPLKEYAPIVMIVFVVGKVILVAVLHPEKAESAILVTE